MDSNKKINTIHDPKSTSLETLINTIDRQLDQVPSPYAEKGFAAILTRRDEAYKKQGRQYIRFLLNGTAFALPLKNAREVDYVPEITPLPNLAQWVKGICNLRGDIVSVVDLSQILDLKPLGTVAARKLILIQNENFNTAIMVEKVAGVRYADDQTHENDKKVMENISFPQFVHSVFDINQEPVYLLDVDALMAALALKTSCPSIEKGDN